MFGRATITVGIGPRSSICNSFPSPNYVEEADSIDILKSHQYKQWTNQDDFNYNSEVTGTRCLTIYM